MLLLVPALVACVVALLCGGSLRRLADLQIRSSALIVGSFLIQLAIYAPALRHSALVLDHAEAIYLAALGMAITGMLRNWRLGLSLRLAALGLFLNTAVIAANGGHMPVNAAAIRSVQGQVKLNELRDPHTYGNTRVADHTSRLLPLSDVLPVKIPGGSGNVYSAGDVLIATGVSLLVFRGMRKRDEDGHSLVPAPSMVAAS